MHLVIATTPPAVTATLPGTPASVPVARRLVREVLVGCPRSGDLMLTVTELATNAINHSASGQGGSFTVRVRRRRVIDNLNRLKHKIMPKAEAA